MAYLDNWNYILAFFVPFWLGCFGYAIYFMWHALAPVARTKFNFYITDFWMSILCLAPTMAVIGHVSELRYPSRERDISGLAIVAFSQLLGIVLARIFSLPRDGETMPRRSDQAIWILAGAYLFGLGGLTLTVIAFCLLALLVMLMISCPPAGIWVLVFGYLIVKAWRKQKGE